MVGAMIEYGKIERMGNELQTFPGNLGGTKKILPRVNPDRETQILGETGESSEFWPRGRLAARPIFGPGRISAARIGWARLCGGVRG